MLKLALGVFLVAVVVSGDVITPPDCATGGGSGSAVTVEVTDLSGSPPYSMVPNKAYTVKFTFTPSGDSPSGTFTVSAESKVPLPIPIAIPQASVATGALVNGQVTSASTEFTINQVFALLVRQAIFYGVVTDASGNTVVCKTGAVNISFS